MAKLVVGENDLKTWCENNNKDDLLSEWNYTSNRGLKNKFGWDVSIPSLVTPNSNITVGWICDKGHKYETAIVNRTAKNSVCPFCYGRKVIKGYNDFEIWCKKMVEKIY